MDETSIERPGSGPEEKSQNTPPSRSLAELEAIVEQGLPKYQEVGSTLDEIHSRRLYYPRYKNFRTYLAERWGISRAHGYRLIAAARYAAMSPIGDNKPGNEHQARQRSASAKGKPTPKPKPKKNSTAIPETSEVVFDPEVVSDPEAEFETFTNLVTRWEKGFSNPDYSGLLKRVDLYVDNILCEGAAEEMEVAA
jgi:hypothetical protein